MLINFGTYFINYFWGFEFFEWRKLFLGHVWELVRKFLVPKYGGSSKSPRRKENFFGLTNFYFQTQSPSLFHFLELFPLVLLVIFREIGYNFRNDIPIWIKTLSRNFIKFAMSTSESDICSYWVLSRSAKSGEKEDIEQFEDVTSSNLLFQLQRIEHVHCCDGNGLLWINSVSIKYTKCSCALSADNPLF